MRYKIYISSLDYFKWMLCSVLKNLKNKKCYKILFNNIKIILFKGEFDGRIFDEMSAISKIYAISFIVIFDTIVKLHKNL
jgi:hypothetical protein